MCDTIEEKEVGVLVRTKKKTNPWSVIVAVGIVLAVFCGLAAVLLQEKEMPPEPTTEPTQVQTQPATVPRSNLSPGDFVEVDGFLTCEGVDAVIGIDVSKYQGDVDWHQVKAAGVEFVMIRLGNRRYGDGSLHADPMAQINLAGAREAGLLVGAYFYSQATTPAEAEEEAAYALEILGDFSLDLPLSFDWEIEKRTENVDVKTATACAIAFCETVEAAGYDSMIYFNSNQATERLDLTRLTDYAWWLAMYSHDKEFPCRFDLWQYTQTGSVPGIEGNVDINIMLLQENAWAPLKTNF